MEHRASPAPAMTNKVCYLAPGIVRTYTETEEEAEEEVELGVSSFNEDFIPVGFFGRTISFWSEHLGGNENEHHCCRSKDLKYRNYQNDSMT